MNGSDGRTRQLSGAGDQNRASSGLQFRAGGRVLSLFSSRLHGAVLRSLSDGPVPLSELHARAGEPSQEALRGGIGNLIGLGALERRKPDGKPDLLDNGLTPLGEELLALVAVLESWLARAPAGPLEVETEAGRAAVKALIAGWSSTILRALAIRPLSLAELDSLMRAFSPSALERRLATMRIAGQIVAVPAGEGNRLAYGVTDWLRHASAPLLAAIRCERRHLAEETAPPARIDFETLFLLSVPLLRLPDRVSGRCQLAVELNEGNVALAGVSVAIERGDVVSCVSTLDRDGGPASRAYGTPEAWLDALFLGDYAQLDFGGLDGSSRALVELLHASLFSQYPVVP